MGFLFRSMTGLFFAAMSVALLVWAGLLIGDAVERRLADDRRAPPARERSFAVNLRLATPGREVPVLESFGEIASRRTLELRAPVAGG